MQRAVYLLCFVIMGLLSALPMWADHEVPYYPSFYPQEIRLDTVNPTAAALLLHDKKMHAYIGAAPHFAAAVPDHLAFMESLRSYRVITFNPASAALQEHQDRCVVARHLLAIFANDFSSGVENIAYDAQLGFNAPVFIRTVKLKDFLWNGWLRLGIDAVPTAAWNPVAGFSDTPGRLIWSTLGEPALFPVPYNASWIPNRVSTAPAVEQHHPDGIVVPHDTVLPQSGTGKLSPVIAGRSSAARVTYQVLASAFHDGTQMDMADLLYPYVVAYRWGVKSDPEQRFYDPAVATATALLRERLVGVRLVRIDQTVQKFGDTEVLRENPVVDVYLNHTAMDDRQVAALATTVE
jgi:hypothetical protein